MMVNLGVQWAGTLLGCIAAIMIPMPVAFMIFGPWIRQRSKLAASPARDMEKTSNA